MSMLFTCGPEALDLRRDQSADLGIIWTSAAAILSNLTLLIFIS